MFYVFENQRNILESMDVEINKLAKEVRKTIIYIIKCMRFVK